MPVFDAWALPPAGITDPGYSGIHSTVRLQKFQKKY